MADKLTTLLQPHLQREVELLKLIGGIERHLAESRLALVGVQERIKGIREAAEAFQGPDTSKRTKRVATRNRGMSAHWQRILQMVNVSYETFTYHDLAGVAELVGHSVTNDTLRSQMSDYKARGWIAAGGIGAFRLTDEGRRAAGISIDQDDKNKAPDAPTPGAFGRVAELEDRPKTSEQHPFRKGENVGSSPTPPSSRPEPQSDDWDTDDDIPF